MKHQSKSNQYNNTWDNIRRKIINAGSLATININRDYGVKLIELVKVSLNASINHKLLNIHREIFRKMFNDPYGK